MPIVARDLDVSEKKETFSARIDSTSGSTFAFAGTVVSATYAIVNMPYPYEIVAAQQAVVGISGTPLHDLVISRFLPGSGATTYAAVNTSFAIAAFGTSGSQGFSLPAAGSTVLQGLAGDLICLKTSGSNSAVAQVTLSVVVKKLQDIVSHFGSST